MEISYSLKDPHLMVLDPLYPKYSPVVCCGYIQDEYSKLFKNSIWLVLTNLKTPKGCLTPKYTDNDFSMCTNGYVCYKCGDSNIHKTCS